MNIHDTHSACDDCTMILANDEGTTAHRQQMTDHCAARGIALYHACTSDKTGYSTRPCDICGTRLHGDRHEVNVLCEHDDCAS